MGKRHRNTLRSFGLRKDAQESREEYFRRAARFRRSLHNVSLIKRADVR